jgi:hypothetical protein
MKDEPNIRQALIDYILLHDRSFVKEKLISYTILDLIVLKTEIELQTIKSNTVIP